jgi:glycyl-tRNA synthetase
LGEHEKFSKKDLKVFDEESKKKILPQVIESSFGVERAFLAFMFDSYFYNQEKNNIILKLNSKLSSVKAAIFPIVKDKKFETFAKKIFENLNKEFNVAYDKSGSIGRRYSRNDEVGTPYCITVDDESIKNEDVTIRDRDTKKQIRVKISELGNVLRNLIIYEKDFLSFGKELG